MADQIVAAVHEGIVQDSVADAAHIEVERIAGLGLKFQFVGTVVLHEGEVVDGGGVVYAEE